MFTLKNFYRGVQIGNIYNQSLSSLPTGGLYSQSIAFINELNDEVPPPGSLSKYCRSFTSGTASSFA